MNIGRQWIYFLSLEIPSTANLYSLKMKNEFSFDNYKVISHTFLY